jgi:hypothetical protein
MASLDCAVQSVLAAQEGALHFQIGMAVAAKALGAARQQGEAVQGMLEDAVQLSKAAGAGENFDAQA